MRRFHVHWHKQVYDAGVHRYGECRCGHRKVWVGWGGHQPINYEWLAGGEWENRPTVPPPPPRATL